jgi:hypothetical protein
MQAKQKTDDNKKVWPFPTDNGVRTAESQALLDKKRHTKTKVDLSDEPEALL